MSDEERFGLAKAYELIQAGEKYISMVEGKKILYFIGSTGVGKTTTLLWLTGKKLISRGDQIIAENPSDDDIGKIGLDMHSETKFIKVKKCGSLMLVDGAGINDTDGTTVDFVNIVSINSVLLKCKAVIPVFLLTYHSLDINRGDIIRELCQYIANLFGDNLPKALKSIHIFFTKCPSGIEKSDILRLISGIEKGDAKKGRSQGVKMVLKSLKKWLGNGMSSQAKIIRPVGEDAEEEGKDLLEYFEEDARALKNPSTICQFAITAPVQNDLKKALVEIEVKIPQWVKEEKLDEVLRNLRVLEKLAGKVEFVSKFSGKCKAAFADLIKNRQDQVILRFAETLRHVSMWNPGDISNLQNFLDLLDKLDDMRSFLGEDTFTREELEAKIYLDISSFAETMEKETDFVQMKLIIEKVQKLKGALTLKSKKFDLDQICQQCKQMISTKVLERQKQLNSLRLFSESYVVNVPTKSKGGEGAPESKDQEDGKEMGNFNLIRNNIAKAVEGFRALQEAIKCVDDILSPEINCDDILNKAVKQFGAKEAAFRKELLGDACRTRSALEAAMLAPKCLLLKELARTTDLVKIVPDVQSSWEVTKAGIIKYAQGVMKEITKGTKDAKNVAGFRKRITHINYIADVDLEITLILRTELNSTLSTLAMKIDGYTNELEQELQKKEINFAVVSSLLNKIEKNKWIDECSGGMGEVEEIYEGAMKKIVSKFNNLKRKITYDWKRKKYDLVLENFAKLQAMEDIEDGAVAQAFENIRKEVIDGLTGGLTEKISDIEKRVKPKEEQGTGAKLVEQITFSEGYRLIASLNCLGPLCVELGVDEVTSAKRNLINYMEKKARDIVSSFPDDYHKVEHFRGLAAQLQILQEATALKTKDLDLTKHYEEAKIFVGEILSDIENEFAKIMYDNYAGAEELLEKFNKARVLRNHYEDIQERIKELKLKAVKMRSDIMESVPRALNEGDFRTIKNELTELGKSNKQQHKKIIQLIRKKLQSVCIEVGNVQFEMSGEAKFEKYKFQDIKQQIEYLENAASTLAPHIDDLNLAAKVTEFKVNLDTFMKGQIEKMQKEIQRARFDAVQQNELVVKNAVLSWKKALPQANDALEKYDTKVAGIWEGYKNLTEINHITLKNRYEALERANYSHRQAELVSAVTAFVKDKVTQCKTKSQTNPAAALDTLEQLQFKLTDLIEPLSAHPRKMVEKAIQDLTKKRKNKVSEFNTLVSNRRQLDRAAKIYAAPGDRETVQKMNNSIRMYTDNIVAQLPVSANSRQLEAIKISVATYVQYKSTFQGATLADIESTKDFKKTKKIISQISKKTKLSIQRYKLSEYPDKLINDIVFLLELANITEVQLVDTEQLNNILQSTTEAISNIEHAFRKGMASYQFNQIRHALTRAQKMDPLLRKLENISVTDKGLTDLKLALSKAKNFDALHQETEKFLSGLKATVEEAWAKEEMADVFRIANGMNSLSSLESLFSDASSYGKDVISFITEVYEDLYSLASKAMVNNKVEDIAKHCGKLQKMDRIEKLLNKDGNDKIREDINAKISTLGKKIVKGDNLEKSIRSMIGLQKMATDIPMVEHLVKNEMIKSLDTLKDEDDSTIPKIYTLLNKADDNISKDIMAEYPHFKGKQIATWIVKTEGQDISYAIKHFSTIELEAIDKNQGWWGSAVSLAGKLKDGAVEKLSGSPYLDKYDQFAKDFKNMVDSSSLGKKELVLRKIISKTRSNIDFMDPIELLSNVFAVWSIVKSNISVVSKSGSLTYLMPHPVQFLTLARMLERKDFKFQDQLVEVLTGEGKSVILGVLSVVFALHGYNVHCICYSEYLSRRDYDDFLEIFAKFEVTDHIRYSTVFEMCNDIVDRDGNIRELTNDFVNCATTGKKMGNVVKDDRRKKVLLIDEVDEFFGSSFQGNTYNPATLIKNEYTYALLQLVWTSHKEKDAYTTVENATPFKELVNKFPDMEALLKVELRKMLREAPLFKDHHPQKYKGKIGYALHDSVSTQLAYGYKTAFAYFHFHDTGDFTEEIVKENVGLYLGCGKYSFAEIPREFKLIMGLSGTLKDLSSIEKEIIKSYGIKRVSYAPSIYGKCRREVAKPVVIEDKKQWFLRIRQQVKDRIEARRAAIVFFADTELLEEFRKIHGASFRKLNVLTEKTQYKEAIIKKATWSGTVTLCPRIFGRGVDFICRDKDTKSAGGVLVIQTFLSVSTAEKIQIQGRCARQGDPGSYEQILLAPDLENGVNINLAQIKKAETEGGNALQELLNKKRNAVYFDSVASLIKKSEKVKPAHALTKKFHKALVAFDGSDKRKKEVIQYIIEVNKLGKSVKSNNFHLYFCLDDSGSMDGQPWGNLICAVEACIGKRIGFCQGKGLPLNDKVTIVNYSSDAEVMCRNENIDPRIHLRTRFRGGGTCFAAGLSLCLSEMKQMTGSFVPVLVFMSDGGSSSGMKEIIQISEEIKNVQIFVIGFGSGSSQGKLQNMAKQSKGQYNFGADGDNLVAVFETISEEISTTAYSL